jgi:hypothetical protein
VVTPKLVSLSLVALFVLLTVGYLVVQVIGINSAPSLVLTQPKDGEVIKSSFITLSGKTEAGSQVVVNDQDVFVASDGTFQATLGVVAGQKQLDIRATNKFDKTSAKTISVMVDPPPQPASAESGASSQPGLSLELRIVAPTTFALTVDGHRQAEESPQVGTIQIVEARDQVLLSTTNAGGIEAKLNKQMLGKLGRDQESLIDVPFSWAQARALVKSGTVSGAGTN